MLTEKQNHEDHLRGKVAIPGMHGYSSYHTRYFFLVVFFAFFAGAFFVAMVYHPLSPQE
jgi:hypothetical protein